MANAIDMTNGDYGTRETERYDVVDNKITIPYEVQPNSVKIRGLEETSGTAEAGKFKVDITAASAQTAGKTEITLTAGDFTAGQPVRVSYVRRVVNGTQVSVLTTSSTAKGELWAHYPVYSSGVDCTDASIKGWVHMYFPRVRVTALPGFDASYKSAQTNGVTFAAIDSKLASHKYYDITYEPTEDLTGNIVAKSSAATVTFR